MAIINSEMRERVEGFTIPWRENSNYNVTETLEVDKTAAHESLPY